MTKIFTYLPKPSEAPLATTRNSTSSAWWSLSRSTGGSFGRIMPPGIPNSQAPLAQKKPSLLRMPRFDRVGSQQATDSYPRMPTSLQAKMEAGFGADFSDVSIHPNSSRAVSMGALAYTQGRDIHFAPGQYDPHSRKGQELIGHELTHVVQQREGRVRATTTARGAPVSNDATLEAEADARAARVAQMQAAPLTPGIGGQAPVARSSPSAPIQRQSLVGEAACTAAYDLCVAGCRSLRTKRQRQLCYEQCMEEYARCLKDANRDTVPGWLLFLLIVAAIVLAAADGPFPLGDAAAAALLASFGIFSSSTETEAKERGDQEL